jgi:aminoglycoside phosphotransferase (APT) family kinase protein
MTRRVLVHGDVSPKNILVGKNGPILLDAECAWYGDPAFDVAFTCTHFLLKMCMLPGRMSSLGECFARYTSAYESHVHWEPLDELRLRCADLLVAICLRRLVNPCVSLPWKAWRGKRTRRTKSAKNGSAVFQGTFALCDAGVKDNVRPWD